MSVQQPINYYGGKASMIRHLLPLIPDHTTYCEPYFGGGALYFAKTPSQLEVISDMNEEIVNFYRHLKSHSRSLKKLIDETLDARRLFMDARIVHDNPHLFSPLKRAWATWVLCNQSFMFNMKSWHASTSHKVKGMHKKTLCFSEISKRLEQTQIECADALHVIKARDSTTTFFYLDPPYLGADQGPYSGFDEHDLKRLLQLLSTIKGTFLLSNFDSKVLREHIRSNNWQTREYVMSANSKKRLRKKTEVLVANYPLEELDHTKSSEPNLTSL